MSEASTTHGRLEHDTAGLRMPWDCSPRRRRGDVLLEVEEADDWRKAEQWSTTALGSRGTAACAAATSGARLSIDGRRAACRGTRDRAFVEVVERRPESRPRRAMRS